MGMDAALSTLEDECAEQGLDYEEVLEQRAYELKRFDELKIPRPAWAGQFTATEAAKKPEAT
jgi:capsid protein